jgi:hypothetical protein
MTDTPEQPAPPGRPGRRTGPPADPERRAELLGGAAAGDLDEDEHLELAALTAADPTAAAELADLQGAAALLRAHASVEQPSPGLAHRIVAATAAASTAGKTSTATSSTGTAATGRRWSSQGPAGRVLGTAAAAALVFGLGGASGWALRDGGSPAGPPTGPPGTLGALEPLEVRADPGLDLDVQLVAHTWGTEAVLDIAGLPAGTAYSVTIVDLEGSEADAGSFVATSGTVACRLNAAVLREDAGRLLVRAPDGSTVVEADLPRA